MHIHAREPPVEDMVVKTKGDKMRIDTSGTQVLLALRPRDERDDDGLDAQKSYMALDFSKPGAPQANTSADNSTIDKSGKHETIAGIDCENWTAHDPSGKRSEVCIAQGIAFFDMGAR